METIILIILGIIAGTLSGILGIGGGIIIIPALIYLIKFNQHMAQGTTLAILALPIGILAAYNYYRQGYVDFRVAALVSAGFFIGGYFGSKIAFTIPDDILQKIFGIGLMIIAVRMIFWK